MYFRIFHPKHKGWSILKFIFDFCDLDSDSESSNIQDVKIIYFQRGVESW